MALSRGFDIYSGPSTKIEPARITFEPWMIRADINVEADILSAQDKVKPEILTVLAEGGKQRTSEGNHGVHSGGHRPFEDTPAHAAYDLWDDSWDQIHGSYLLQPSKNRAFPQEPRTQDKLAHPFSPFSERKVVKQCLKCARKG
jgi:hypothetical protein